MGALKLIFATLTICTFAHSEYHASIYGMQALKLLCDTDAKFEFVHRYEALPGFDVLRLLCDKSVPVEILVAPDRLREFKQALDEKQIRYEVYVEDFSKVIEQELAEQEQANKLRSSANIPFESFPSYSEIKNYLQNLSKKFNSIVETFSIGKSYEGRDIVGIKISNGPAAIQFCIYIYFMVSEPYNKKHTCCYLEYIVQIKAPQSINLFSFAIYKLSRLRQCGNKSHINMQSLGTIFAALAFFTFAHGEYQASIYGMQALKVFCNADVDLEFLHSYEDVPGFDFLRLARDPRVPVEVLVASNRIQQFKQDLDEQHIEYEVLVNDVSVIIELELEKQERARKLRTGAGISFESFPRYSEIKTYLESLSTKYSNIVETFSIGKTFEGRDIVGIRISSNLDSIDKRVMVIDAGIHAREWIAPTTALYAINQLVENSTNHHFFKDLDIYVIPSLNVDGYEYSHQNASTRLWRKTRSVRPGLECIGADANRNFDMAWMSIGASSNPCSETFAGIKAFSEPEAVALQEFILSFGDRFKSFVSLHSYGNYILHPWGYTYDLPKNSRTLKCVADRAASELFKLRGTRYTTGSKIAVLYATSGTSVDWAMGKTNTESSYTVELPSGKYGFVAPPSEILPVGRETFEAIKIFIRHAKGEIVC